MAPDVRGSDIHPTPPPSLETLMCAFLDGDARAFEAIYAQLAPRVARILTRMSGDGRVAEDLTQAVFLKLFRSRDAYTRGAPLTPWVFAMARNTLFDYLRQTQRRPEHLSADGSLPELDANVLPDTTEYDALREVLAALPPSQRQALLLLKWEGMSLSEAAAFCGTSPASIKMRVHRAYVRLRTALAEREER